MTATATARTMRADPRRAAHLARGGVARAVAYAPARAPERVPAPRRHLRVVEAPTRRARRRRRRVKLLGIAAVFALLTIVGFHAFLAQNQIALDHLEEQTAKAQRVYQEQRLENAEAKSPARIMAEAQKLGLVTASPPTPVPVAKDPAVAASSGTDDYSNTKPTLAP